MTGGVYTDIWLYILCKLLASNLAEVKLLTFQMFICLQVSSGINIDIAVFIL